MSNLLFDMIDEVFTSSSQANALLNKKMLLSSAKYLENIPFLMRILNAFMIDSCVRNPGVDSKEYATSILSQANIDMVATPVYFSLSDKFVLNNEVKILSDITTGSLIIAKDGVIMYEISDDIECVMRLLTSLDKSLTIREASVNAKVSISKLTDKINTLIADGLMIKVNPDELSYASKCELGGPCDCTQSNGISVSVHQTPCL